MGRNLGREKVDLFIRELVFVPELPSMTVLGSTPLLLLAYYCCNAARIYLLETRAPLQKLFVYVIIKTRCVVPTAIKLRGFEDS